jgi:hypothetical protein
MDTGEALQPEGVREDMTVETPQSEGVREDMTESKHTPGPWNISKTMMPEDCRGDWRIADQYDNDLADVFCEATSENGYTDETNAANAALIAAAPDMKAALQRVLRALATEGGHVPDVEHARESARAALAKAEGR